MIASSLQPSGPGSCVQLITYLVFKFTIPDSHISSHLQNGNGEVLPEIQTALYSSQLYHFWSIAESHDTGAPNGNLSQRSGQMGSDELRSSHLKVNR